MSRFRQVSDEVPDERPDLAEVLEHYGARVRPTQAPQMVRCVMHEDNTPSMSVSLMKQLWNCHSCSEGGDVYELISLKEGTSFAGAVALGAQFTSATGGPRESDSSIREGRFARRRKVSDEPRDRQSTRRFRPTWRGA